MAIKKSDLYGSLWKSCDELRGSMDASQYKDYVLVILFVKYVSDRYAENKDSLLEVPLGGSFQDLLALRNKPEIGDKTNQVIAELAEANDLCGVIDIADFNDSDKLGKGQDMVDRLSRLFTIFDNPSLNFSANNADGDDLLGDAYEYLMRHFATESGKAKGQFYTPSEVSKILAAVVGVDRASSVSQTIYDPTCGSGSLLLKAHSLAQTATGLDLAIYGQEMDNATSALAKMNMILHGVETAEVEQDNTLSSPYFKNEGTKDLKQFDFVVANPPFSNKSWTTGLDPKNDIYDRFSYGVPPEKNGDYAFLLHMLASLKPEGKAAVILPHGVLFRNVEGLIRANLIRQGFIKAIIGLPPNLFYGTGIPAVIIILDKEGSEKRSSIFMIDASRGFVKDGNKNRLRERDLDKIIKTFNSGTDVENFARTVPVSEVSNVHNDYNLNLPKYVSSRVTADHQDLLAHLAGGIPDSDLNNLESYWRVAPDLRSRLFEPFTNVGYSKLRISADEVAPIVEEDADLEKFSQQVEAAFINWRRTGVRQNLVSIDSSIKPSKIIKFLSESILDQFTDFTLIDEYALYQSLMEFWSSTMRDDVELVRSDGWMSAASPTAVSDGPVDYTLVIPTGKGKKRVTVKFRSPILPRELILEHFCGEEFAALKNVEFKLAALQAEQDSLLEKYADDEGVLVGVTNDKGAVTDASIKSFKSGIPRDPAFDEEVALIAEAQSLLEEKKTAEVKVLAKMHGSSSGLLHAACTVKGELTKKSLAERKSKIPRDPKFSEDLKALEELTDVFSKIKELTSSKKDLSEKLEKAIQEAYANLDEETVVALVVDGKWLATISSFVESELSRSQAQLVERINVLSARYSHTLPEIEQKSEGLSSIVSDHLATLGLEW